VDTSGKLINGIGITQLDNHKEIIINPTFVLDQILKEIKA